MRGLVTDQGQLMRCPRIPIGREAGPGIDVRNQRPRSRNTKGGGPWGAGSDGRGAEPLRLGERPSGQAVVNRPGARGVVL
eukprot:14247957-Alexandrium_andersonii.AAC.1